MSVKKTERDKWLQVRASEKEIAAWNKIAAARGMSLSAWVRQALYAEAEREKK